jgi:hypothetical protein
MLSTFKSAFHFARRRSRPVMKRFMHRDMLIEVGATAVFD